jgi:hypothetical protein
MIVKRRKICDYYPTPKDYFANDRSRTVTNPSFHGRCAAKGNLRTQDWTNQQDIAVPLY